MKQGEVIEEDLFNEFWTHYFRQAASLRDVLHAYNSALLMLIEKIARNNRTPTATQTAWPNSPANANGSSRAMTSRT
jgi:uncharacterized protein YkwD